MPFDKQFIQKALSRVSILCDNCPREPKISIDSRTIEPGEIFVALRGAHHDGHDFIEEVLRKNAAGVIIADSKKDSIDSIDPALTKDALILSVPDPLQALVDLAHAWRMQFEYPVLAVTGSVGKTSTKEMIAQILNLNGNNYLASYGNQNTKIGVALNILRMRPEHDIALFEVGVNKRGEMDQLASMLRPTVALITNVGHSHMEGLGSLVDIALEKRMVFNYFTEQSIGIVNGDQSILSNVSYPHPVLKFGSKTTNQIQARKMRISGSHTSFVLKIYQKKYSIVLRQSHAGVIFNALAAAAAAQLLQVPIEIIVKGIQTPLIIAHRFEQRAMKKNNSILIDDSCNANPESMKAALLAFQQIETKAPKIAVLGDMLELGVNSPFWHRQLGRFLRKAPSLSRVILVGDLVKWTKKTAPAGLSVDVVPSWQDALKKLDQEMEQESVVLIKGSQATGLCKMVDKLAK